MTTANIAIPEGEVHLLLHDVPWELYVQLREELDNSHRRLRLVYDGGRWKSRRRTHRTKNGKTGSVG
jgi:hypothetical protein